MATLLDPSARGRVILVGAGPGDPGLLAVTGYNGRGVTTGTVVGQAFARYLCSGDRHDLPLPLAGLDANPVGQWRSLMYEAGFTLYHAGQCLRVVL